MTARRIDLRLAAFWEFLGDLTTWVVDHFSLVYFCSRLLRKAYDWFPWKPKGRLMLWIIKDGYGRTQHYSFGRLMPGKPLWRSVEGKPFYKARIVTVSAVNSTVTTTKKETYL